MNIAFRVAADEKMPLVDLKDLRALMNNISERSKEDRIEVRQRGCDVVGRFSGGSWFWKSRARTSSSASRLSTLWISFAQRLTARVCRSWPADRLMEKPRLYATFLLWMLSKLWMTLPKWEIQPKPKLVFFFDEALHLLFNEAPKALLERIEQVARLIRSKGVGV